jgi:hypothetical protein
MDIFNDVQQFPQYQQDEQSPLNLKQVNTKKKTMTYDVGNPGPGL